MRHIRRRSSIRNLNVERIKGLRSIEIHSFTEKMLDGIYPLFGALDVVDNPTLPDPEKIWFNLGARVVGWIDPWSSCGLHPQLCIYLQCHHPISCFSCLLFGSISFLFPFSVSLLLCVPHSSRGIYFTVVTGLWCFTVVHPLHYKPLTTRTSISIPLEPRSHPLKWNPGINLSNDAGLTLICRHCQRYCRIAGISPRAPFV